MTFRQFLNFDEADQELVCWAQGVRVAERTDSGYTFHLFQVSSFYIEVEYNVSLNTIQSYTAFECMQRLDPYLQTILIDWPPQVSGLI